MIRDLALPSTLLKTLGGRALTLEVLGRAAEGELGEPWVWPWIVVSPRGMELAWEDGLRRASRKNGGGAVSMSLDGPAPRGYSWMDRRRG